MKGQSRRYIKTTMRTSIAWSEVIQLCRSFRTYLRKKPLLLTVEVAATSAERHADYVLLNSLIHIGEKHFLLFPPADVLWLEEVDCRPARYQYSAEKDEWIVVEEHICRGEEALHGRGEEVPWVEYDEASTRIAL